MTDTSPPAIAVPLFDRLMGAVVARWPGLMRRLGDLESRTVAAEIADVRIVRPVYVCGVARAGSTMLLEALAAASEFTSHRYSDYPLLWTPYWWNSLRARLPLPAQVAHERAHRDRIAVTAASPEAFEELLWMSFFPHRHDPAVSQVLDAGTHNPAFEAFYPVHIRKLLAIRARPRYLAKGNYNLTRLAYLQRLFPDARFVIAVRHPLAHVASLVKQDRLFCSLGARDAAVARHLARSGHYEFGSHKTALNTGDNATANTIQRCFASGATIEGYARQWAASYGTLAQALAAQTALAGACLLVDYAALCTQPAAMLQRLYAHAAVDPSVAERLIDIQAPRFSLPGYYDHGFSDAEADLIQQLTAPSWQLLQRWTTTVA